MRRFKKPESRVINAKFAGKCLCCGGDIPAGALVTYHPGKGIAHLSNYYTGDSAMCSFVVGQRMKEQAAAGYADPGELAADRWNDTHH